MLSLEAFNASSSVCELEVYLGKEGVQVIEGSVLLLPALADAVKHHRKPFRAPCIKPA